MKLYQIEHINEDHNKNRVMGMELKFTHSIDSCSGRLWKAEKQPDDWDHVKRLTHMLFLAWNDKNPIEGVVYLGELVGEKNTDDENFYNFFKEFNGFPINSTQKKLYDNYKNGKDGRMVNWMGRQVGVSVFLLTLAAYKAKHGEVVYHYSFNCDACRRCFNQYNIKIGDMYIPTPPKFLVSGVGVGDATLALFDNCVYWDRFAEKRYETWEFYRYNDTDRFWVDTVD